MHDYAYVAFLDILGYRQLLERDMLDGTSVFRDKMTRAFRHFETINRSIHQYQVISDAIYFTCSDRNAVEGFLGHLKSIFLAFLGEGLLLRGGATYGQHFMNNSVTYSPALTKAYSLETEHAIFPRIMVDANIIEMFPGVSSRGLVLPSGSNWFLHVVDDSNLDDTWLKAKNTCNSSRGVIEKSEHIRIKHKWLQDYLIETYEECRLSPPRPYIHISDLATEFNNNMHRRAVQRLASVLNLFNTQRARY